MPINPEQAKLYPDDWKEISERIRFERAGGQCEQMISAQGSIGPLEFRCTARHGEPHPLTGSKVVLTVAHLDHNPAHCADDNLKAMCQRCHLKYDLHHHRACDKTGKLI